MKRLILAKRNINVKANAGEANNGIDKDRSLISRIPYINLIITCGMKSIMLTLLGAAITSVASAQFVPYSQYHLNPLLTNPAHAGMTNDAKLLFQYRQAKVANYEIPAISFLYPLFINNGRSKMRYGGIGLTVIRQSSGPGNLFNTTGAIGGFAYNLHLSREHHLSVGLQGGIVNKRIDVSKVTTESQFSGGVYDPSLFHGENFNNTSVTRPVINAGFSWYLTDRKNQQKASLGAALYNMNRPSYDILSHGNKETVTYVISGEVEAWKKDRFSLHPSFRYILSHSSLTNIGMYAAYALSSQHGEITAGAWYKSNKAVVFSAQYSHASYLISAAYEFSAVANLEANLNSAFEIVLGLKLDRTK